MIESARPTQDKRSMRRFAMQLPVQVKAADGSNEVLAVTKDVSARGVFIYLDSDLAENSAIEFTLTLPPEVTMTQSIKVRCTGTVVRIDRDLPGKIGVAAAIDHYQFMDADQG